MYIRDNYRIQNSLGTKDAKMLILIWFQWEDMLFYS